MLSGETERAYLSQLSNIEFNTFFIKQNVNEQQLILANLGTELILDRCESILDTYENPDVEIEKSDYWAFLYASVGHCIKKLAEKVIKNHRNEQVSSLSLDTMCLIMAARKVKHPLNYFVLSLMELPTLLKQIKENNIIKEGERYQSLIKCGDHWLAIDMMQKNSIMHFFLIDSIGKDRYEVIMRECIKSIYPDAVIKQIDFSMQKDVTHCSYFAITNAIALSKIPDLHDTKHELINFEEETPKEFFSLIKHAQSLKTIKEIISNNPNILFIASKKKDIKLEDYISSEKYNNSDKFLRNETIKYKRNRILEKTDAYLQSITYQDVLNILEQRAPGPMSNIKIIDCIEQFLRDRDDRLSADKAFVPVDSEEKADDVDQFERNEKVRPKK